jgi:hypothetical protein
MTKAKSRNLLTDEEYTLLKEKLSYYYKLINPYIKSIGKVKGTEEFPEQLDSLP